MSSAKMTIEEYLSTIFTFFQHPFKNDDNVDLLHIPSIPVSSDYFESVPGLSRWCLCHEERFLCFLLHLNNRHNRVFYVTSMPVSQTVIDYYLSLLTQVSPDDARKRLTMVSCYDTSLTPLCKKLMNRPRLMRRLKDSINPKQTYLSTYVHTELEQKVALKLGISAALTPVRSHWGTKLGSRQLFQWCEIPHCLGTYNLLESTEDVVEGVIALKTERPKIKTIIIKLNEGVDGLGNAIWRLPESMDPVVLTKSLICNDLWPFNGETPREFLCNLTKGGAIMEEFIEEHGDIKCPSVEGYVDVSGNVCVVSTHEHICVDELYQACFFPANAGYRLKLQETCTIIGNFLKDRGVRNERYGVDFLAWQRHDKTWDLRALEVNLRYPKTTHSMMTLQLVTFDGHMNQNGMFLLPNGEPRCYFALDSFHNELLKKLTPDDLLDMIKLYPTWLKFDKTTMKGTIFYMVDALATYGSVGIMCIHETPEQASRHFHEVKFILLKEAGYGHIDKTLMSTR